MNDVEAEEEEASVVVVGVEEVPADRIEAPGALTEPEDELVDEQSPVIPPVAPVAAIPAATSTSVEHVIDVPGLLTSGSGTHVVPAP